MGEALLSDLCASRVDVSAMARTAEKPTRRICRGDRPGWRLVLGLADMDIFALLTKAHLDRAAPLLAGFDRLRRLQPAG